MRCFLPCFGTSKRRKQNATHTQSHVGEGAVQPLARQKTAVEELIDCIAESKIKNEAQSNNSVEAKEKQRESREEKAPQIQEKKDVHEEDEINRRSNQEESSESLFSLSICSRKKVSDAEAEVNSPMQQQQQQLVCNREVPEHALSSSTSGKPSEKETKEPTFIAIKKEEESSAKELINKLDDDDDDSRKEKRVAEGAHVNRTWVQEETSDSLFSLSTDSRKRISSAEETENEVNKLDENEGEKGKVNHPVPQHRYGDCPDEGCDDVNLDATFEDDDDSPKEKRVGHGAHVNRTWILEETSDSLFSLSTDSRKRISSAEEAAENEVNSLMTMPAHVTNCITQKETQGRIPDVTSVLDPIENVTQGRLGKTRVQQPVKKDKENINLVVQGVNIPHISPEPSFKLSNRKARQRFNDRRQEIEVDTSLSSWLVESETTPASMKSANSVQEHTPKGRSGSPWSHEDRPILGALTVEEIRMFSISISPKKSRSRSLDETPIIGTVGSYWSHTQQTMDLEFNKSGKVKRNSTALQAKLERAFEASASEV